MGRRGEGVRRRGGGGVGVGEVGGGRRRGVGWEGEEGNSPG